MSVTLDKGNFTQGKLLEMADNESFNWQIPQQLDWREIWTVE